jgi:hypothetical protein
MKYSYFKYRCFKPGDVGMTSTTSRRVGPAAIEGRRAKITAEIAALGLPLPGSLVERLTRSYVSENA